MFLLYLLLFILYLCWSFDVANYVRNTFYMMKLPGPPMCPIIGWTFKVTFLKPEDIPQIFVDLSCHRTNSSVHKCWIAGTPIVILTCDEDMETLLKSPTNITKGEQYIFLKPWLKTGLLISTGDKWHQRRKLLTAAFHFKILEDALPMMNNCANVLVQKLSGQVGKDILVKNYINLCTLDIICETAMGVKLNAQDNQSVQYVKDIEEICEIFIKRNMHILLNKDFTFYLTMTGFRFKKIMKRLHTFTTNVIKERKQILLKEHIVEQSGSNASTKKRKQAFLDCLIELELNQPGLFTEEDIRDEVDTFMFEGHDTTSSALVHTLMFIGMQEDIQEKLFYEMESIFGSSGRDATTTDLSKMNYLEQVIKESLRLMPSVPIISRCLDQDFLTKEGYLVPKFTNVILSPLLHHQSENNFPDPKKFDPERFSKDQAKGRPPFAYFPFSAGPRNCIGQRFAMMELKIILSTIIRQFHIYTLNKFEDVKVVPLITLKTKDPIYITFKTRNKL